MTENPMELVREVIPELFNGAVADLRAAAEAGDAGAKARLEGAESALGAVFVRLEGDGGGDVYLVARGGKLSPESSPGDAPVVAAVATPFEPLEILLEESGDRIEAGLPRMRKRLSRAPVGKIMPFLSSLDFAFHSCVTDTPDFDEVRTKVALGSGEVPEKPGFTLSMDHDVFEGLQQGKIKPAALLSKLQIEGDASDFLQFCMDLASRAQSRG